MRANILFAEDDVFFARSIKRHLERAGYNVILCENGQEGWEKFQQQVFDLCLLDVVMPRKDGFALAEDIRAIDVNVPIIFSTSRYMKADRLRGFESGADDYIVKPFSVQELLCRIDVYLRRSRLRSRSRGSSRGRLGGRRRGGSRFGRGCGRVADHGQDGADLDRLVLLGPDLQQRAGGR